MINPMFREPYIRGQCQNFSTEPADSKKKEESSEAVSGQLPNELWSKIYSYLPQEDLGRMSMVNKRHKALVENLALQDRQKDLNTLLEKLKQSSQDEFCKQITSPSQELENLSVNEFKLKIKTTEAVTAFERLSEEIQRVVIKQALSSKAFIETLDQIEKTPLNSLVALEKRLEHLAKLLADFFISENTNPDTLYNVLGVLNKPADSILNVLPKITFFINKSFNADFSAGESFIEKFFLQEDIENLFQFYTSETEQGAQFKGFNSLIITKLSKLFGEVIDADRAIEFSKRFTHQFEKDLFLKSVAREYCHAAQMNEAYKCFEAIDKSKLYQTPDIESIIQVYCHLEKSSDIYSIVERHLADLDTEFLNQYVIFITSSLFASDQLDDLYNLLIDFHYCINDLQREIILNFLGSLPTMDFFQDIENFFSNNPYNDILEND